MEKLIRTPFSPIRDFKTHNIFEVESPLPLFLFDLDGTLYKPTNGNALLTEVAVRYLNAKENELKAQCPELYTEFARDSRMKVLNILSSWKHNGEGYDTMIAESTRALGNSLRDVEVAQFETIMGEFIKKHVNPADPELSPFFSYTRPVIETVKQHGVYPVLVTGAMEECMGGIRDKLGIPFTTGVEFVKSDTGGKTVYTGDVKHIRGSRESKDKIAELIVEKGHAILGAMGDSKADSPLITAALTSREAKGQPYAVDFHGRAIIINPTVETEKNYKDILYSFIRDRRLKIFCTVSSQGMEAEMKSLIVQTIDDPRNWRKIRDLLKGQGKFDKEIEEGLRSIMSPEDAKILMNLPNQQLSIVPPSPTVPKR